MGLLTQGAPLQWSEIEKHKEYIKKHGIAQFINLYNREKNRFDAEHKWGDEVEYTLVKFDDANKTVRVSCRAAEILPRLNAEEELNNLLGMENAGYWRPEFASFQIEGSPGTPFGEDLAAFNDVEANLNERRKQVRRFLKNDESMMSISFPGLGASNFTHPPMFADPTKSIFFPDDAVNGAHPRYKTLMNIIRDRREDKIDFHIPVFRDINTPNPFIDDLGQHRATTIDDHIYLDHMGIGCGCCGLQVTMQTVNEDECRWLYDQLTPMTPVLLALSAASPIFKSILSDIDSRWEALSAAVDDRNREERGLQPLNKSQFKIDKRRLGTTDCYVHPTSVGANDIPILYDEQVFKTLLIGEIDEPLAKHIAHLFIRDPLVVYEERIIQDVERDSEHFETIQCTNWNNVRFKPPPADMPDIGWRVEFRPTEVQLTDFETTAYCCFIVLLSRVIMHMNLNTIIPMSKVDENMKRAQKRDAVLNQKFFFRKNTTYTKPCTSSYSAPRGDSPAAEVEEFSIDEIVNGKESSFPGLIPLIREYLDSENLEDGTRRKMEEYLDFMGKRASGEINTLARWMRNFVASHSSYKKDSRVPVDTMYEMIKMMDDIASGRKHCEKLLGDFRTEMKPLFGERERRETITSEFEKSRDKINDIFMDSFDRKAFYELVAPEP